MPIDEHREAEMLINGQKLTKAQSMAVRCAVASMLMDYEDPTALGDDEHGRAMVQGYRARLSEVQDAIFKNL